jgi:hypothetical protein
MRNQKAFSNLLSAVNKVKQGSTFKDPNEGNWWKVEGDKAGNGSATIRFLPGKTDDSDTFVKYFSHGFKENNQWYIENCPTTIGQKCPVCDAGNVLWATGLESNKAIVRTRKRKTSYVSNVLVIKDPTNPDNEGKVFLFKYGQKIFDKIVDKIQPEFEDDEALNPFDPIEGADFKIKMRRVDGHANFDKSEFASQSEIDFNSVVDSLHDLGQFIDKSAFKDYDKLKERFVKVTSGASSQTSSHNSEDDEDVAFVKEATKPKKQEKAPVDDDDDDDLAYFQKLAEE